MIGSGCRALVTGGLGFIGSNLARRLVELGAEVTIVDSLVAGCGANRHNVAGLRARVLEADIGRPETIREAIESADVIFNLAGEVSHLDSMLRPERDLEINAATQLRFLHAVSRWRRGVRVVYASTRQIYGIPEYLPVDETHPIRPVDFNGVHKFAATQYHTMLTRQGDLDAVALLLTNVYGPRQSLTAPNQGFLGVFLRKAARGERLTVYGDGSQVRDPLFVDDCVEAFLKAAELREPQLRRLNVGGAEHLPIWEIATLISRLAGLAEPCRVPFPDRLRKIDIGSYFADSAAFRRATGWEPRVPFAQGVARTLAFYREHLAHYLPVAS
jgi:UDP-glucose 4-epimerase